MDALTTDSGHSRPTIPFDSPLFMTTSQIKTLITILLKQRPDLVIVKTENQKEKQTLVKILKNSGGNVIYRK